ncbi:phage capsid protein [Ralstonia solanacearum]|uniref:recombination directionality factor n=1 Tax=Ralstonia pseudosolanacearum TaxID=1310165 RepID=UPI001402382E|nr:phage capsid protein [Ralstonia pseudosolanacearum]KAF3461285.1 phage capsid protein [Ralstonia solanacearum]NKA77489.1 phage capsid protein [Ralstonia solanacearum]NKG00136.1 phage capsid protein [Ralstonia solanacearum]NKG04842.1 phage capsid protein [Ralstonia solanacearum]UNJ30254.1 phage capsid protein [Ralstonia pseudosolanacearum]
MLKGLSITPPILGRISIGRIVEKNGKRLPEKDDAFTLTTQVQQRGEWLLHPLNEELRKASPGKLRAIPVRMLFNDPDLNLRADYSLFDRETGRPVCVGNGETCRRVGEDGNGIETLPCSSPDGCSFGQRGGCKPYARLNVVIGDDDELGSFVFRTTSFNSIRSLAARLQYFRAVSGNLLACLPLELKLRGKSTTQSFRSAIYYVDLSVRTGSTLEETLLQAKELDARRRAAGFDQVALDAAARAGFANGAFEDSPEEQAAVAEEFYPEATADRAKTSAGNNPSETHGTPSTLRDKLERKAVLLGGAAA